MANRMTRVPDRPVPSLPGWVRPAIPLADLFMLLMWSRPRSGSLSRTWVTPATLQLCLAVVALALLGCFLVLAGLVRATGATIGLGAGLPILAIGSGAVALVGVAQRRA